MQETATAAVTPPSSLGRAGATLPTGHIVGARYRIDAFIAGGGMGEVYIVDDLLLREQVALKLLRPELSRSPTAVERFAQEIRLARKVTHNNVCRVFDVGTEGERIFFTMEHVAGETLAARLARVGAHDLDAARPLVRQLLDAVEAAHKADVVHADLKPSNVMLAAPNDCVVITDFGLAMPCCAELGCSCSMPHLLGTPAYMAPEQVTGGSALMRTDVFALGVMLFEMVTGRLPFTGDTARELAFARLREVPPLASSVRPGLDPTWCLAIRDALARDPAARTPSVAALRGALALAAS
jgi:eukaryotic-like serine/threonine-protein kinase